MINVIEMKLKDLTIKCKFSSKEEAEQFALEHDGYNLKLYELYVMYLNNTAYLYKVENNICSIYNTKDLSLIVDIKLNSNEDFNIKSIEIKFNAYMDTVQQVY